MAPGVAQLPENAQINHIYPVTYSPDVEAIGFIKLTQEPADIMKVGRKGSVGDIVMIIGDGMWESEDVVKI